MFTSSKPLSANHQFMLRPEYLELLIGLAMLPLLAGLLGQQQLLRSFLILGSCFEGIFQGIALPFLDLPE